jgi:hypothetical protein
VAAKPQARFLRPRRPGAYGHPRAAAPSMTSSRLGPPPDGGERGSLRPNAPPFTRSARAPRRRERCPPPLQAIAARRAPRVRRSRAPADEPPQPSARPRRSPSDPRAWAPAGSPSALTAADLASGARGRSTGVSGPTRTKCAGARLCVVMPGRTPPMGATPSRGARLRRLRALERRRRAPRGARARRGFLHAWGTSRGRLGPPRGTPAPDVTGSKGPPRGPSRA